MSESTNTTTTAERLVSLLAGGAMLIMAVLGSGWTAGWALNWARNPMGLPSDMAMILLAASLGTLASAIGAWRLLLLGGDSPILGLSRGRLVLVSAVLAAIVGAITA